MKEYARTYSLGLDVVNPNSGELMRMNALGNESSKYYSISKLTTRINHMDLFKAQQQICKSSKDIELFAKLSNMQDKYNEIRFDNISQSAKKLGVARSKLNDMLKRLIDADVSGYTGSDKYAMKLGRGVYFINPFVFQGNKVLSNEQRELNQVRWIKLIDEDKDND